MGNEFKIIQTIFICIYENDEKMRKMADILIRTHALSRAVYTT